MLRDRGNVRVTLNLTGLKPCTGAGAEAGVGAVDALRFARVARNARPGPGEAVFRVALETAPGEFRDLLSSEVYSFRSGSSAAAAAAIEPQASTSSSAAKGGPRPQPPAPAARPAALDVTGVAGGGDDGPGAPPNGAVPSGPSSPQPVRRARTLLICIP